MVQITISDELAQAIADAGPSATLVDSHGRKLAQVTPLIVESMQEEPQGASADDEWAEARLQMEIYRREGGTFYTTREVLEHLKSLEKE